MGHLNQKSYGLTTSLLFALFGLMHILRIAFQWDAMIGGWTIPMWFSAVVVVVAGYLSYEGCRLAEFFGRPFHA